MKCPFCENEMKIGKICSNAALWWKSEDGEHVSLNDEGIAGLMNGYRITAFRCEKCEIIIINN